MPPKRGQVTTKPPGACTRPAPYRAAREHLCAPQVGETPLRPFKQRSRASRTPTFELLSAFLPSPPSSPVLSRCSAALLSMGMPHSTRPGTRRAELRGCHPAEPGVPWRKGGAGGPIARGTLPHVPAPPPPACGPMAWGSAWGCPGGWQGGQGMGTGGRRGEGAQAGGARDGQGGSGAEPCCCGAAPRARHRAGRHRGAAARCPPLPPGPGTPQTPHQRYRAGTAAPLTGGCGCARPLGAAHTPSGSPPPPPPVPATPLPVPPVTHRLAPPSPAPRRDARSGSLRRNNDGFLRKTPREPSQPGRGGGGGSPQPCVGPAAR